MKFLAIEKEICQLNSGGEKQLLCEEAKAVYQLQQRNMIREIYFDENHCAVIILECTNKAKAKSILDELPLVKSGNIEFRITELKPYTGFSRLFQV